MPGGAEQLGQRGRGRADSAVLGRADHLVARHADADGAFQRRACGASRSKSRLAVPVSSSERTSSRRSSPPPPAACRAEVLECVAREPRPGHRQARRPHRLGGRGQRWARPVPSPAVKQSAATSAGASVSPSSASDRSSRGPAQRRTSARPSTRRRPSASPGSSGGAGLPARRPLRRPERSRRRQPHGDGAIGRGEGVHVLGGGARLALQVRVEHEPEERAPSAARVAQPLGHDPGERRRTRSAPPPRGRPRTRASRRGARARRGCSAGSRSDRDARAA